MSPGSNLTLLKERAFMLKKVRSFFDDLGFTEVDTPLLSDKAPIDLHIELFKVLLSKDKMGYLHSSPEYGMKKLLAEGIGDIYQLGHVYRRGEVGALHNPVFTMIEWYRQNISYEDFIKETCSLIFEFLGPLSTKTLSYHETFETFLSLDIEKTSEKDLAQIGLKHNLHLQKDSFDSLLNQLWGCLIEPQLGQGHLTVIIDYPASQAALAQIKTKNGRKVAERFELYYKGIELGNGYHELTDYTEQKNRLIEENEKRKKLGLEPLPIDTLFLKALQKGLPDCYGIAVGFDRLMMLRHKLNAIHPCLPSSWEI